MMKPKSKLSKWSIFAAIFIALLSFSFIIYSNYKLQNDEKAEAEISIETITSDEVRHFTKYGKFKKAIELGQMLVQKSPHDPKSHFALAEAYLSSGQPHKAEKHYAETYRLFPAPQNEENLATIKKRNSTSPSN